MSRNVNTINVKGLVRSDESIFDFYTTDLQHYATIDYVMEVGKTYEIIATIRVKGAITSSANITLSTYLDSVLQATNSDGYSYSADVDFTVTYKGYFLKTSSSDSHFDTVKLGAEVQNGGGGTASVTIPTPQGPAIAEKTAAVVDAYANMSISAGVSSTYIILATIYFLGSASDSGFQDLGAGWTAVDNWSIASGWTPSSDTGCNVGKIRISKIN